MLERIAKQFGLATAGAAVLTVAGSLLSSRSPGHFQQVFHDDWDYISVGFVLLITGALICADGVVLYFSTYGGFKDANVKRGALLMAGGLVLVGTGIAALVLKLFG
ncbi:hypothetical protein ACFVGM_21205 [Kitasatospora purpeofusca]|uniref:hypothetical protein n=1 Tax=Kitasatospora purpeofusca TaxID=67352 RepID=UPI0034054C4F